jgi:GTP cyclohydrolase II
VVHRYAESDVPTEYGVVRLIVYRMGPPDAPDARDSRPPFAPEEHVAIVVGEPGSSPSGEPVLVRVHSECWTGEVLHSHKCDCKAQLDLALRKIAAAGRGVVVYLRQEGRGIGLGNKVRAYALQEEGVDTVDANRILGFADDERTYDVAAAILSDLGALEVALLTNNPKKVEGLRAHGIRVTERVPATTEPNEHNADYLAVKARRMGHEF